MGFPVEEIPDADNVYRLVHTSQFQKPNRELPRIAVFAPHQGEQVISVDWSKYTNPTESLLRVGKTYKTGKPEFKNPAEFQVFEMNVGKARRLVLPTLEVLHDPLFIGDPEPEGSPNNRSHAHIQFPSTEEEDQLQVAAMLLAIVQRVL
jgi:hypothetical protein